MRRLIRTLSWFVVFEGILLGMLVIAVVAASAGGFTTFAKVCALAIAGVGPIVASMAATRNSMAAAGMSLWPAPIALLFLLLFSPYFGGVLSGIGVFFGAFVVPGLFWRLAARRNWPPILPSSFFSDHLYLPGILGPALVCVLIVVASMCSLALPWWDPVGDCGGRSLLDDRGAPRNIDFTAQVISIGPRTYKGRSLFAVVRIDERLSQSPATKPDVVILRGFFEPSDKSRRFFVEGQRSNQLFNRYLPVIQPIPCGRTRPIEYARAELRVLHDGPPKTGARLIGRVYRGSPWNAQSRTPVPGINVFVESAEGNAVPATDAEGIYDATGLPPGGYTLHLAPERHAIASSGAETAALDLKSGEVEIMDFYIR